MSKKDFTKAASNAADIFFSGQAADKNTNKTYDTDNTKYTYNTNNANNTHNTNDVNNTDNTNKTKYTHVTNKSKHYDNRGKRGERYGLLMDKQLKDDLRSLANATGSPSVNDLIVTILLEYVETPERQGILEAYRDLQTLKD